MASPRLTVFEAIGAYAVSMVLMIALGPVLYGVLGRTAMIPIQVLLIAGPPLFLVFLHGGVSRVSAHGIGLRPAPWMTVVGGALVGISFWYLNLAFVAPIGQKYLGGDQLARDMETTILGDGPLWATIAIVAVFPALCEELLARGALARALVPHLGRAGAVVVSAFLFGIMHLHPAQALPAAVFGLLLGYATVRTDSVWPAVVMHLGNNAMILFVAGEAIPALTASTRTAPELWLPIAGFLSVSGCLLIRIGSRPGRRHSTEDPW